jgi:hypothetical protein
MRAPSAFQAFAIWRVVIAVPSSTGQFLDLRGKVAGDAPVEPALDLSGQIKNFDSHGVVPSQVRGLRVDPGGRPSRNVKGNIGHLADRFQYLSVNIP